MKKVIEFLIGTSIVWLPIITAVVADKLAELITMETIANCIYALGIVSVIKILKY